MELLLDFPAKRISQKTMQLLSCIYLHSPQRAYKLHQEQKKQISLTDPTLERSSGLVNEACVGSIGVNLLFLFLLVRTELSGNGNQPEICTWKGMALVHHLCSSAFFRSQISTLQHPYDCYFGLFSQFRNSFHKKYLLMFHRECITRDVFCHPLPAPIQPPPVQAPRAHSQRSAHFCLTGI